MIKSKGLSSAGGFGLGLLGIFKLGVRNVIFFSSTFYSARIKCLLTDFNNSFNNAFELEFNIWFIYYLFHGLGNNSFWGTEVLSRGELSTKLLMHFVHIAKKCDK